jgi:hypothetical protein
MGYYSSLKEISRMMMTMIIIIIMGITSTGNAGVATVVDSSI